MRSLLAFLVAFFAAAWPGFADEPSSFDWSIWQRLPVQDGGRQKPLDTMAWETLRMLGNRASMTDPETGQRLDATALYVTMLFQGERLGDRPKAGASAKGSEVPTRQADKWDRAPLLRVDHPVLRQKLGMSEDQKYIAPADLEAARIEDPQTGRESGFMEWANRLRARRTRTLPLLERKATELAAALEAYQEHRAGLRLGLVPSPHGEHEPWISAADLLHAEMTSQSDPTGLLRQAKARLLEAREALRAGSADRFNEASAALAATLAELGPQQGAYPAASVITLEVAYNRWVPFRFAWVLTTLAFVCVLLSMGSGWRVLYGLGVACFAGGLAAMLVGFGMRIAISGRAPVTNMYESVVYLALGTSLFGLVFEWFHRRRYVLAAAAAVSTVALILADNCPAVLDPSLQPLTPVLRSNFWLVTHVMSITLSYAAFALALGIGNITLGYYLVGSRNEEAIAGLTQFTYRALQTGVLLLFVGTVLGGVWADYAWGRFWGWDPKEVWALVALLGYLAVLHARYLGWVSDLGLAALSVICFALVVMAWYGVNYVLGAGLHSYGFGGGGQGVVLSAIVLQCLYVGLAVAAAARRGHTAFAAPVSAASAPRSA
jgi:cytochrome c-type biogenesis protein CcsB